MKKKIMILAILSTMLFGGCFAGISNDINKRGGFIGSHKADYIIVNTTGSMILDIYKLKDMYVSENTGTDGVNFKHPNTGSHISLQGDVKIIRNPTAKEWDMYVEYHADELFCEELKKKGL
ncbi:MAG: hypothetical protein ACRCXT_04605 [Paraclostridium sp.]